MSIIRRISAALPREFESRSQDEIGRLRSLIYQDYLQTDWWKWRRNRALHLAGFRCSTCPAKNQLQVHHVSYERLGAERDVDLEVLCQDCHERHHQTESRKQHIGIYVRLVSEAIRSGEGPCFTDLTGAVRDLCLANQIPFDAARVSRAIESLGTNRLVPRRTFISVPSLYVPSIRPFSHFEAVNLVRDLGITVGFRGMPSVLIDNYFADMEKANQIRALARSF